MSDAWYDRPLDRRAPAGGEIGVDGRARKGGEFEPFYVPRPVMPQIDEADYPALHAFAATQGVSMDPCTLATDALRAHQRVDAIILREMPASVLSKPVLASGDLFILDGNHRWAAHKKLHLPQVAAIKVGLEFEEAIRFLLFLPSRICV